MPASGPGKREWALTGEAFRRLLEFLDADRDRAAERYEKIREKLARFFEWRGCIPGQDYADETIDRAARRLEEGLTERPENPYLYLHGIALNVVRERWRKAPFDVQPLETLPETAAPAVDPFEVELRQKREMTNERRLTCLQECLDRLPRTSADLVSIYHLGGSGLHIGRRRSLAETLNIPAAALRLRVYRIRRQLEKCMGRCLAAGER